jgi:hypothetical protein
MTYSPQDYLDQFIIPAARALNVYTLPHLQIGFGTGAQESGFQDIDQIGGPAKGPWQMEPATHASLWMNFIAYRPAIKEALIQILGSEPLPPDPSVLEINLVYAAAMMFVKYLDSPGAIPIDLDGQAAYYVTHYNAGGKATTREYIDHWNQFAPMVTFPSFE